MSDSNEIKTDQKHPRLRLPQAGIEAQQAHDAGEPLTTDSFTKRMNDVMLDLMNGRVDREYALALVQVGNSILKAAALELKNRELFYTYTYKQEGDVEPSPLQLVAGKRNSGKKRATG